MSRDARRGLGAMHTRGSAMGQKRRNAVPRGLVHSSPRSGLSEYGPFFRHSSQPSKHTHSGSESVGKLVGKSRS